MRIISEKICLNTKGNPDLVNITKEVKASLSASKLKQGLVTVFVIGSTAAITTFEYEPGLIKDIKDLFEKLIPSGINYQHDQTWGDANGFSHLRAALQGPSIVIPFEDNKLLLGTWQQIVLLEFDNRPRERYVVVQIMGE